jgi:hypothetical protein
MKREREKVMTTEKRKHDPATGKAAPTICPAD